MKLGIVVIQTASLFIHCRADDRQDLCMLLHGLRVQVETFLDMLEGIVDQIFIFPCFAYKLVEVLNEYSEVVLVCFLEGLVPLGLPDKVVDLLNKTGNTLLGVGGLVCQNLDLPPELREHLEDLLHRRSRVCVLGRLRAYHGDFAEV
ncbi:hypothetical protein ACLB2K_007041 [Fragaria x ananassa]